MNVCGKKLVLTSRYNLLKKEPFTNSADKVFM